MRAVVAGMIATYGMGGVAWDYGQYALGLEQLGFEVSYLEDTGVPAYSFNPATGEYVEDPSDGVRFLQNSLAVLSPSLADRWHVRAVDGRTFGLDAAEMAEIIAEADLFLNVSGSSVLREAYRRCRRKVFIDTDPGWNHFVIFPRWDHKPAAERALGFRSHDVFFTYAQRIGQPDCPLPAFGLAWHVTQPPVVLDRWQAKPAGTQWTTVMSWSNYPDPLEHNGVTYGAKELEFDKVEDVPGRSSATFEVAINAVKRDAPCDRWRSLGWSVVDANPLSRTAIAYRDYIERSRGEFSVAKNVYTATRSGWFSCRSTCYLAAGLPVVLQDTGFSDVLPVGSGVLPFTTTDEAVNAIDAVERDYAAHQQAARELARDYFDAKAVLGDLLDQIGLD